MPDPQIVRAVFDYSNAPGHVPPTVDPGTLPINQADGFVFTRGLDGSVKRWRLISPEEYAALVAGGGGGGGPGLLNTDFLPEGSANLYFTASRARSAITVSGSLSYNPSTGALSYFAPALAAVATTGSAADLTGTLAAGRLPIPTANALGGVLANTGTSGQFVTGINPTTGALTFATPASSGGGPANTDSLPEGATNLYFTTARARAAISVSGSLTYNATTGVISYTAPTLATVATSGSASDLATGTLPAARLPNTTVTPGSYTLASVTIDATGRVTAASSGTASGTGTVTSSGTPTSGQLARFTSATDIAGVTTLPAANFPALTGDLTTTAGSLTTTLAASGVTAQAYTGLHSVTFDAKGRATAAANVALTGDVTTTAGSLATTIAAGVVTFAKLAAATVASAASDVWTNVASKVLSVNALWSSQAFVTLADAATIATDMSTFLNAKVTLAGNRTLGTPTNAKEGQSGLIQIIQDGTGSRTLAYATGWDFGSAGTPTLSTAAGKIDTISYVVINTTGPVVRAYFGKSA